MDQKGQTPVLCCLNRKKRTTVDDNNLSPPVLTVVLSKILLIGRISCVNNGACLYIHVAVKIKLPAKKHLKNYNKPWSTIHFLVIGL